MGNYICLWKNMVTRRSSLLDAPFEIKVGDRRENWKWRIERKLSVRLQYIKQIMEDVKCGTWANKKENNNAPAMSGTKAWVLKQYVIRKILSADMKLLNEVRECGWTEGYIFLKSMRK